MNIQYLRPFTQQPAIKLNTVNVIELTNGTDLQAVRAFADNPKGNKRAEKLFRRLIEECEPHRYDETDFTDFLDEGTYEDGSGYQLFLVHSV